MDRGTRRGWLERAYLVGIVILNLVFYWVLAERFAPELLERFMAVAGP